MYDKRGYVRRKHGISLEEYEEAIRQRGVDFRGMTHCRSCNVPLEPDRKLKNGLCQPCSSEYNREGHLRRTYGLSEDEYQQMKAVQGDRCMICEEDKPLIVDHDHKNRRVRGLICQSCNIGIGHLRDDPRLLRRVIEYLEPPA